MILEGVETAQVSVCAACVHECVQVFLCGRCVEHRSLTTLPHGALMSPESQTFMSLTLVQGYQGHKQHDIRQRAKKDLILVQHQPSHRGST